MKVLLINGSPRKGNTMTALNALKKGLAQMPDAEVEEIICAEKTFIPCKACNACGSMSRCIFADDSPETNAAVEAADAIVFATPVYWWGMSAQMKLLVDKFYARDVKLRGLNKKVGSIVIGEADQDDPEYEIIAEEGPEHLKEFTAEARLNGKAYGRGTGPNKKKAEQEAARVTLAMLKAEDAERAKNAPPEEAPEKPVKPKRYFRP